MIVQPELLGGPFDLVLDVGGNLGDFAALAHDAWPQARVVSFEPVRKTERLNRQRSAGRWETVRTALSDAGGEAAIHVCENQHSASSLHWIGLARWRHFGIRDRLHEETVRLSRLDYFLHMTDGRPRVLVKIDVEGHELQVILGGGELLSLAQVVVVEVQNDPEVFLGAAPPAHVDLALRRLGLVFSGLADAFHAPDGRVLQFDAVYRREV